MLDIPPSTLRRYVNDFGDHLSAAATKPRGRRFNEVDITTLQKARELLRQGQPVAEANKLLGVIGDPEQTPTDALALVPSISAALTEAVDIARGLRLEVDNLADDHALTSGTVDALADWVTLPWYKKIGKAPPDFSKPPERPRSIYADRLVKPITPTDNDS